MSACDRKSYSRLVSLSRLVFLLMCGTSTDASIKLTNNINLFVRNEMLTNIFLFCYKFLNVIINNFTRGGISYVIFWPVVKLNIINELQTLFKIE